MKKIHISILACILMFCSCDFSEIDFDNIKFGNADFNYEIAVDGYITSMDAKCCVILTKPKAITDTINYEVIDDAKIQITDGVNIYPLYHKIEGLYESESNVQGKQGVKYTLEIEYNGKKYYASDVMPADVDDNFYAPLILPDGINNFGISYNVHNFGYDEPMIWALTPFWDDPNHLHGIMFSGTKCYTHEGSPLQGVLPGGTWSVSNFIRDSAYICKISPSPSYYNYLLSVFDETYWRTGIFSTIQGNTQTNLSEGAVGYFYAVNTMVRGFSKEELLDEL